MPQRARPGLAATLVAALTERLPQKAAAVVVAAALWVVASGDEPGARYVEVRFVPVLDGDAELRDPLPTVRALVVGPARELLKLYGSPPVIRRAIGRDAEDSVRLELRAGDVDLPRGVLEVAVRDVRPRTVTLRLETFAARRLPVRVAVRAADGVLPPASDFVVEPDTVLVRGPRRIVNALDALATVARVVGPGEALGEIALDTARAGVRATPARVRLLVRTRGLPAAAGAPEPVAPPVAVPPDTTLPRPVAPPVPPDTVPPARVPDPVDAR